MVANKVDMSQKLLEYLIPIIEDYGIKDILAIKGICDDLVQNKQNIMMRVATSNIVKNELFDTMSEICEFIKIRLMKLPELENLSLNKFNELCSRLPKAIVYFSYACTKIEYSFIVDLDNNNEEFIEINRIDTNICEYKFTGIAFRSFVSKIVKALNNVTYFAPNVGIIISVDDTTVKDGKIDVTLDLEDMITIMNLYIIAVNTKFVKVANKSFKFKSDVLDNQAESTNIKSIKTYRKEDFYDSRMALDVDDTDDIFTKLSDILDMNFDKKKGDSL